MSEEEKKAIFTLNEIDVDKLNDEENESINIITRLIAKQQKEIEWKQECIEYLQRSCDRKEDTIIDLEMENNCISKDKIREIINNSSTDYAIYKIKELLEE